MKAYYATNIFINFSFDVPEEIPEIVVLPIRKLSSQELEERSDYYIALSEIADQLLTESFLKSTIGKINVENLEIEEMICIKVKS